MRFYGLAVVVGLFTCAAQAQTLQWGDIRDGSLYLRPSVADELKISWVPAWQSDGNHEQLYLLDPQGQLAKQVDINPDQAYGQLKVPLGDTGGDYRLQVPGYSFRGYRLSHADTTAAQFEPTKLHFSADVAGGIVLYFRVLANETANLAGKYYGGVSGLQATRLSDGSAVHVALVKHDTYAQFDQAALPTSSQDEVWRLTLEGSGKSAFWLDGSANLFAQDASQLHGLALNKGTIQLVVHDQVAGPIPKVGIEMPYALPPTSAEGLFEDLGAKAAAYYSFVDVTTREPEREFTFRKFYQEQLGLDHDITLLAGTGRRAVLDADSVTLAGLDAWLADTIKLGGKGVHYLAFADEPNLNYPDYATFASYFGAMLAPTLANKQARAAGVRVAMPASSRWLDGPLRSNAARSRGIEWARLLLKQYGSGIDALAWHEWMVRDLLATRRYRDSVRQAADLVGLDASGRPRKALLLDQTNISSGSDLSPYQQDTHYASLWWASVVINASQDGLLDTLDWFQAVDEDGYSKGMLQELDADTLAKKPVAYAQAFIHKYLQPSVQLLDNSGFEVDALATVGATRHSLLGVNKTARLQGISLMADESLCQRHPALELSGADNLTRRAAVVCKGAQVQFDLPGETLFALTWDAP